MEYSALIISLVALGFSIYSVVESRRNNRASHRPAIVGHEINGIDEYQYEITNKGTGPAFFKSVEWFWDKKPLEGESIVESVREVLQNHGVPSNQSITDLGQQSILSTGETIILGSITIKPEHIPIIHKIQEKGFGVRIIYESGFGEEYTFVSDDDLKFV